MTENFSAITQKIEEHKSKVTKELENTQSQLTKDLQEYNESLERLTRKGTAELQNSLELQEKELTSKLKQQHQKRLKLIDSQLEENWNIAESLLKAPIIKISLVVATLGIIIGIISTIMIKAYLIPSESQVETIEVSTGINQEEYNQLVKAYNSWKNKAESQEKEIEQLQATRTANKQLIQELQVWQVPNGYQFQAIEGKFIRVPKENIYTEQEGKIYIKIGD